MATQHALLRPFKASRGDPFDRVKAAHLLNRAGFGGTPEEIEKAVKLGPQGAADWLLGFPDTGAAEQSETDVPDMSGLEEFPRTFREVVEATRKMSEEDRRAYLQKFQMANREALLEVEQRSIEGVVTGTTWSRRVIAPSGTSRPEHARSRW